MPWYAWVTLIAFAPVFLTLAGMLIVIVASTIFLSWKAFLWDWWH